jgi:hypothetical protein
MEAMIVEKEEAQEVLPKEKQQITKVVVLIKGTPDLKVQLLVDLAHMVILQNLHLLLYLK